MTSSLQGTNFDDVDGTMEFILMTLLVRAVMPICNYYLYIILY